MIKFMGYWMVLVHHVEYVISSIMSYQHNCPLFILFIVAVEALFLVGYES